MKTIKSYLVKISEKLLSFFIRWRRWVFIPFFVVLVVMEAREVNDQEPIHILELAIYFSLIIIIALLVELLLRAIRLQTRVVKTLDYKHQISRELIAHEDWESLSNRLIERLAKMEDFVAAQLFLWDSTSQEFSLLSQYPLKDEDPEDHVFAPRCKNCPATLLDHKGELKLCHEFINGATGKQETGYCLPVFYHNEIFALVRFMTESEHILHREQIRVIENLGDEIAIALTAGQDRNRLMEIQLTETALAERHKVSQYLHDNLSQNIGYIKIKLEQFAADPGLLHEENIGRELNYMKETAEESYAIVRNKLESIHTTTLPTLASNLREHASRVSERAGFDFSFTVNGNPKPLSMEVQRAVFYVFQEILSNVEKHARAGKVDIVMGWGKDKLSLIVSDDGIGFNSKPVDTNRHIGLSIVRERLKNVNGKLEVMSEENVGTTIKVKVPLSSVRKREHA